MDIREHIKYWLDSAAHDFDVVETLYKSGKYDWCLFAGHLVIEKVLKAFYVIDVEELPPRTHNLLRLAERTTLLLSDEQKLLLGEITRFKYRGEELYGWLLLQIKQ